MFIPKLYYRYAVIHSCFDLMGFLKAETYSIMSTTPTLPSDLMSTLMTMASLLKIDTSSFVTYNNTSC